MTLQIHPDGVVYIRDGKQILYEETIQGFEQDYGSKLDALPVGYVERLYTPGVLDRLGTGFTHESTALGVWTQGDDILSKVVQLVNAKRVRNTPVAVPPSPRELEKAAALERMRAADINSVTTIAQLKPLLADILKVLA
jgi:hypothetical protein